MDLIKIFLVLLSIGISWMWSRSLRRSADLEAEILRLGAIKAELSRIKDGAFETEAALREQILFLRHKDCTVNVDANFMIPEVRAKVEILKSRFSNPSFSKVWLRDGALRSLVSELDPFITEELSDDGHVITLTLKVLRDDN